MWKESLAQRRCVARQMRFHVCLRGGKRCAAFAQSLANELCFCVCAQRIAIVAFGFKLGQPRAAQLASSNGARRLTSQYLPRSAIAMPDRSGAGCLTTPLQKRSRTFPEGLYTPHLCLIDQTNAPGWAPTGGCVEPPLLQHNVHEQCRPYHRLRRAH